MFMIMMLKYEKDSSKEYLVHNSKLPNILFSLVLYIDQPYSTYHK